MNEWSFLHTKLIQAWQMITGMVLGFTMPCKRFFQNKFWMDNEAQCDEEDKIIWLKKKKNWVLIGVYDSGWLKTSILVYSTSVSASSSLQERKCISKTYLCKDSLLLSFLISHLLWQDVCCITTSHCVVILCYICMIFMQIFLLKCVTLYFFNTCDYWNVRCTLPLKQLLFKGEKFSIYLFIPFAHCSV